jgi:formylglycine-generating enzyme required for sulfatase activity
MRIRQASAFFALTLLGVQSAAGQAPTVGDTIAQTIPGTDVAFSLVFVPGGVFPMGSPPDEPGRDDDEGPVRVVRLSSFWMGAHEVSQEAFALFRHRRLDDHVGPSDEVPFDADAITRPSPPYEDPSQGMGQEARPAVGMTRFAALHYARWLSFKTGRLYRLPTEAEWEYACRAGGDGVYGFGSDPGASDAYAWFEDNAAGSYHAAGQKAANQWGLHDMHGNVAEWVMDSYATDAYAALPEGAPAVDPVAGQPPRGRGLVRGGAFDDAPDGMRCAERFPEAAAWKRRDPQVPKSRWWNTDSPHVGFRLVSPATPHGMDEIRAYWAEILGA